ncbi:hypothetical protein D3C81_1692200 [compost metagenome]
MVSWSKIKSVTTKKSPVTILRKRLVVFLRVRLEVGSTSRSLKISSPWVRLDMRIKSHLDSKTQTRRVASHLRKDWHPMETI